MGIFEGRKSGPPAGRGQKLRDEIQKQQVQLGPTLEVLGLSTEGDLLEVRRKVVAHGMKIVGVKSDDLNWGFFAVVRRPHSESDRESYRGFGSTESEAICFAAAKAFLASKGTDSPSA